MVLGHDFNILTQRLHLSKPHDLSPLVLYSELIHLGMLGGNHPSAISCGDNRYCMVFQQWHEEAPFAVMDTGIPLDGEWRDIPIEDV